MEEFTASNGVTVTVGIFGGVNVKRPENVLFWLSSMSAAALREFFLAERDAELGRWRWPENPDYVVYRVLESDDSDGRGVQFLMNEPRQPCTPGRSCATETILSSVPRVRGSVLIPWLSVRGRMRSLGNCGG